MNEIIGNNDVNKARGNKALKSGLWYTISSISVKAILIITTPIFTRLMTTSDYGISANFSTWFALLNVIASLNLWYSIGRAKLDFPGKIEEFVGSIQLLAFSFALILELTSLFFIDKVSYVLDLEMPMLIALYVYLLVYPSIQLTQSKFKYTYDYKSNIFITLYITVSTVLFSLLFVLILPNKALGKSLGAVITTALLSVVVWVKAIQKKNIKINLSYWKYGLIISVPLILNSISLNILAQSDRVFITKFCGSNYTGIYSLAYSYALLINIVLNSVNEAWLPWFHDTLNEKQYTLIKQKVKPLIVFGCWFGLGCVAIAPEAIMLLGGSEYKEGIWVVPPVTLGIVCSYIFQHYEHIELHLKKTWYVSAGTIFAAAVNIILNLIFIPIYGFVAAAYTTLICYFILMILHHFISRKILKMHIYHDKYMYVALFVTCIISMFFMILYNYFWIWRWILIVVISFTFIFIYRELIVEVLRNFFNKKK